jgi:hypothetical protein
MSLFSNRQFLVRILIVLAVVLLAWFLIPGFLSRYNVAQGRPYLFAGVKGPEGISIVTKPHPTLLEPYGTPSKSRLAVLITDPASNWLGLVHGFKSIGLPFVITQDYKQALDHAVVLVYPEISGSLLKEEALKALAEFPGKGGILIGINVLGAGMQEVFGFQEALPSRAHFEISFTPKDPLVSSFSDQKELTVRVGNPRKGPENIGTYSYTQNRPPPRATYEDGTVAITQKSYGRGRAYAVGFDLGFLLLRGYNNRAEEFARSYVNQFEPSLDVLLGLVKAIYQLGEPSAVSIGTVPSGKSLSVLLTHDIDYTKSMENAIPYAEYEKSQGIRGTYFIQTKYIRDYNDDVFFNEHGVGLLKQLAGLGMDLGSHTVAHSRELKHFPLGSGAEQYPSYSPFVKNRTTTLNGTILGELRVSKFLIEAFSGQPVVSFRPGELSNPFALPQALEGSGYQFSSSVTANSSLTHLPFQLNYARETAAELNVFEFPVTVEDEESPKMGERLPQALELAKRIRRYGGCFVVLIHPNVLDHKLAFEKGFVNAVKDFAWFGSLTEFGQWWSARNMVTVDVYPHGQKHTVVVGAPRKMTGLTLEVPEGWLLRDVEPKALNVEQAGRSVVIRESAGEMKLLFESRK